MEADSLSPRAQGNHRHGGANNLDSRAIPRGVPTCEGGTLGVLSMSRTVIQPHAL